ncbi:hypothetical protein [Pseudomonas akapageensis]|uniref:hypothetical protein n=1 Tax=Pseudomonas akapageensis TaxID=2609961 RepID=UPI00140A026F|nr:hypothetical protein [Pseudomonas akapageensis]
MRSGTELVFLWCGLALIAATFLLMGWLLYMAYFKMDEMLKHLSRSSAIKLRKPMVDGRPMGRLLMLNAIAMMLAFPKKFLADGGLHPEDHKSFPRNLRLRILIPSNAMIVFAMLFMTLWGVGKYMDWIK